jgi:hypothetical protein
MKNPVNTRRQNQIYAGRDVYMRDADRIFEEGVPKWCGVGVKTLSVQDIEGQRRC